MKSFQTIELFYTKLKGCEMNSGDILDIQKETILRKINFDRYLFKTVDCLIKILTLSRYAHRTNVHKIFYSHFLR